MYKNIRESLLEIAYSKLTAFELKDQVHKSKGVNYRRTWTKDRLKFIVDNYGKLTKKEIAEVLKVSVTSVNDVCYKILGLKNWFYYSDEVTLNQLARIINGNSKYVNIDLDSYTLGIWTRYGIPYKKICVNKELEYKTIKIKDFLEWLKNNKRVIDIGFTEEGCFGCEEPEWLKIKRDYDKRALAYKGRFWTPEEDEFLKKSVEEQILEYDELSKILKRTYGSIKRRCIDLKLSKRPVRRPAHDGLWTKSQIDKVKEMWIMGAKSCVIAEEIEGKSAGAINGILERYKYFGEPPLKYKL